MQWEERKVERPKEGSLRERSGFLLFSRAVNGKTRWLERGRWEEKYTIARVGGSYGYEEGYWKATRWLDLTDTQALTPGPKQGN